MTSEVVSIHYSRMALRVAIKRGGLVRDLIGADGSAETL